MSDVKSFNDLLNSPEWQEMIKLDLESKEQQEKECDEYWDNLSYEDKLKSFYSVVKRIVKGDIKDRGTYRYVLYDVFGFDMDSYDIGMQCGYMALHNSIVDIEELEQLKRENKELKSLLKYKENNEENCK